MPASLQYLGVRIRVLTSLVALALTLLAFPQASEANEEVSKVEVDCEELDSERRAAIEARQLGELKTRGGAPGRLALSCEANEVFGSWSVGGREVADRSLSRKPGEDPTELLHWLAAMLLETREERAQAGIDDVALATSAGASEVDSTEAESNERTNEPEEGSKPTSPQEEGAPPPPSPPPIDDPPDAERSVPPSDSAPPPPLPPEEQPAPTATASSENADHVFHFVAGAAGKYQHWGSGLIGSLGPALFAGVEILQHSTIEAEFSPQFSLRRTEDFGATEWTGTLRYCGAPVQVVEGCLGGVYSMLRVSSPSSATGDRDESASGGVELLVRALFGSNQTKYFTALGLRVLARDRQVLLNQDEIATIPRLQLVVALGLRGRP